MGAAWGFEVAIGVAWIVVRISESVPMIEEEFDRFNRNRKAESFAKCDLHIGDADHFPTHIKQRSAAVARIDLRRGLEVKLAAELARLGAENAFRNSA